MVPAGVGCETDPLKCLFWWMAKALHEAVSLNPVYEVGAIVTFHFHPALSTEREVQRKSRSAHADRMPHAPY